MSIKRIKHGFTVVEISLFLAITALIFVGMIVGVNASLRQNHYEEDVRSLQEFLQSIYSQVMSVEGEGGGHGGNSEKVIYGKLITFNEKDTLGYYDNSGRFVSSPNKEKNNIYIYDVIGDVASTDTGSTLAQLKSLNAKVTKDDTKGRMVYAGLVNSYEPRWGSRIESKEGGWFQGTLLIVRSPATGSVFTYASDTTMEINRLLAAGGYSSSDDVLLRALGNNFFSSEGKDLDICLKGDGVYGGKRKDIRIEKMARSSAGVKVLHLDEGDNRCQ